MSIDSEKCCKVCANWRCVRCYYGANTTERVPGLWAECTRMAGDLYSPRVAKTLAFADAEYAETETHESFCCNMFERKQ